jgi:hypothetical protein
MNTPTPSKKMQVPVKTAEIETEQEIEEIQIDLHRVPSGSGKKSNHSSKKKNGPKNKGSWKQDHIGALEAALMAPDLIGPVRVPRYGNSDRTVLGLKKLRTAFACTTGQAVQGLVLKLAYGGNICERFQAVDASTVTTAIAGIAPDVLYPPSTNITDSSMVAACITLEYTGKPIDAQGEVLLCTVPDNAGDVSAAGNKYSTLQYLPNAVVVPVSSLIDNPLRVSLLHQSPSSWDFTAINETVKDVAVPLVAVNGAAIGATFVAELTLTFECRSAISSGNVIPYEAVTGSKAADLSMFENVVSDMGELYNQVSEYIPTGWASSFVNGVKSSTAGYIAGSMDGLGRHLTNRILGHLNSGNGSEFRRILF